MNILKIIHLIMQIFGWKRECKVPLLPSPKVFNLQKINFLTTSICYLHDKESSENQEVAAADDYSNGMIDKRAIMPAQCQIDIPDSTYLLVGVFILVGLCLTCRLKIRLKKAKPICTIVWQEDEEDIFLDFQFDEDEFIDLEFDDEEEEFFDLATDEEEEEFFDLATDEGNVSWHSSVNPQYVLHCNILSDEECARAPDVN